MDDPRLELRRRSRFRGVVAGWTPAAVGTYDDAPRVNMVAATTRDAGHKGFRVFLLIWLGQSVSLVGSSVTGFALGVWVYQRAGSVTQFAFVSLFTALPGILFSPIAGALVDRWDRRRAMMLSDAGSGLCTLAMATLLLAGRLQVWHIYVAMALSSTFSAFQWPAYSAATTLLVPKQHYGRSSGMVQLSEAVAHILSPVIAGVLMGAIGIQGVILIDVATMLFALATLLFVRVPRPPVSAEGMGARGSLLSEAAFGWRYVRARPGLLSLLAYYAAINYISGIIEVLFTPLVLSFASVEVLGLLMSIGGLGFLAGSLAMSAWGGPRRRIYGIFGAGLLGGAVLFVGAVPPRVWTFGLAAFLFFVAHPVTNTCNQAIWMSKTAPDVQGRVFAARRMIAWASLPLAYVTAGPLADRVFEPLLAVGGPLAGNIGRIIGVGKGRGVGLLFVLCGVAQILAVLVGYLSPRVRNVETELPDFAVAAKPGAAGQS